jgi:hypothetical protein
VGGRHNRRLVQPKFRPMYRAWACYRNENEDIRNESVRPREPVGSRLTCFSPDNRIPRPARCEYAPVRRNQKAAANRLIGKRFFEKQSANCGCKLKIRPVTRLLQGARSSRHVGPQTGAAGLRRKRSLALGRPDFRRSCRRSGMPAYPSADQLHIQTERGRAGEKGLRPLGSIWPTRTRTRRWGGRSGRRQRRCSLPPIVTPCLPPGPADLF